MATSRVLIRGGLVIDTEPHPVARSDTDVLIDGGVIVEVGRDLAADGAEVLDAAGRIVLPGFVDTHRHTWQSLLRATAVDLDLMAYLDHVLVRLGPRFGPGDVRLANLLGALECLDSGITTLMDFSHALHTPAHADAAIDGLRAAGIRAVFGYGYPYGGQRRPDVRRLSKELSGAGELVTLALAPAGPSYSPPDVVEEDWRLARELGIPITVHVGAGPIAERPIAMLRDRGLLGPDTLYVHGNSLPVDELTLIAESGGAMSVAPAVEARMGHGGPMVDRLREAGVTTGLGVDVVTTVAGDMFSLMRAALLAGDAAGDTQLTAAEALRMATLDGAVALGLADQVGSLRPGKQADIVMLRATDINLVGAGHDPIGAVVTAAHPGNVEAVLVAGEAVKQDGRLTNPALAEAAAVGQQRAAGLAQVR